MQNRVSNAGWGTKPRGAEAGTATLLAADTGGHGNMRMNQFASHEPNAIEQFMASFKSGIFGVLFVMSKDASSSRVFTLCMMCFDFVQMMGFPLNNSKNLPWHTSSSLDELINALALLDFNVMASSLSISGMLFYVSLVWVLGLLACAIWVGYSFAQENFAALWPLKLLRLIAQLTTTALFIPITGVLMSVFTCNSGESWGNADIKCWDSIHSIITLLVSIIIILFGILSAIVVSAFFDRNPLSDNITSMVHGRVAVAMILLKAALALVFTQVNTISAWWTAITCILTGVAWLSMFVVFLPYYSHAMNKMQAAFAFVYLWAGICLGLAVWRDATESNVSGFTFLSAIPLVAFTGSHIVDLRYRMYDYRTNKQLSSPFFVELQTRRLLSRITHTVSVPGGLQPGGRGTKLADDEEDLRQEVLREVDQIYGEAMLTFPESPMLNVFIAHYLDIYRQNRHLESSHLAAAEMKDPAMDAAFIVFQRKRQLAEAELQTTASSAADKLDVISRVRFEKYRAEAMEADIKARHTQVAFWTELLSSSPDIHNLTTHGSAIADSITRAENAFSQLLRINAKSIPTLRLYAQFLIEVTNNSHKAETLLMEADSIEDEMSRQRTEMAKKMELFNRDTLIDFGADNVGVVTISSQRENLGIMLSVNAAACKMYGYTKREMVGKSVDILIPEPMAAGHNMSLTRYLDTGERNMLQMTRAVMGVHRQGYLLPLLQETRSTSEGFTAIQQPYNTNENFLLFMSQDQHITAACQESMSLLALSVKSIEEKQSFLHRHIPALEEIMVDSLKASTDGRMNADDDYSSDSSSQSDRSMQDVVQGRGWSRQSDGTYLVTLQRCNPSYHGLNGARSNSVTVVLTMQVTGVTETGLFHREGDAWTIQQQQRGLIGGPPVESAMAREGSFGQAARDRGRGRSGSMQISGCPMMAKVTGSNGMMGIDPRFLNLICVMRWELHASHRRTDDGAFAVGGGRRKSSMMQTMGHVKSKLGRRSLPNANKINTQNSRRFSQGPPRARRSSALDASLSVSDNMRDTGDPMPRSAFRKSSGVIGSSVGGPSASMTPPGVVPGQPASDVSPMIPEVPSAAPPKTLKQARFVSESDSGSTNAPPSLPASTQNLLDLPAWPEDSPQDRRASAGVAFDTDDDEHELDFDDGLAEVDRQKMQRSKSFGNRSFGSSVGSRASTVKQLRQAIDLGGKALEPGLAALRKAVLWIFVLVACMTIVALIAQIVLLQRYDTLGSNVVEAASRHSQIQRMLLRLSEATVVSKTNATTPFLGYSAAAKAMSESSLQLKLTNSHLFRSLQLTSAEQLEHHTLFFRQTLTLQRHKNASVVDSITASLLDASALLHGKSILAYALSIDRWDPFQPDVWFIRENTENVVYAAVQRSTQLVAQLAQDFEANRSTFQQIVLICGIALTLLVSAGVVFPITRRIEGSKNLIFHLFLDVPTVVVRTLRKNAQTRLDRLQAMREEEDAGYDEEQQLEESLAMDEAGSKIDWSATSLKSRNRKLKKSIRSYLLILLRFWAPMLLIIIYFASIFGWYSLVSNQVNVVSKAAMLSSFQEGALLAVMAGVMRMAWTDGTVHDYDAIAQATSTAVDDLLRQENSLVQGKSYGTQFYEDVGDALNQPSGLSAIFLDDACSSAIFSDTVQQSCAAYYGSVLSSGAHAAMQEFAQAARKLVNDRQFSNSPRLTDESTRTPFDQRIVSKEVLLVYELGEVYLAPVLRYTTEVFNQEMRSTTSAFQTVSIVTTVMSVLALFIFYGIIYRPLIRQMDLEMKKAREMLLIFPEEVIRGVTSIRETIEKLNARSRSIL